MNSAKMVLDASLLEATFCAMQCTVGYSTVGLGVFFSALRGGELFSLFRFNFREETWSTVNSGMYFKRVHHRTKLTSVCRDTYSSLIASQDVKPNCTKQSDVKKRKTKKKQGNMYSKKTRERQSCTAIFHANQALYITFPDVTIPKSEILPDAFACHPHLGLKKELSGGKKSLFCSR